MCSSHARTRSNGMPVFTGGTTTITMEKKTPVEPERTSEEADVFQAFIVLRVRGPACDVRRPVFGGSRAALVNGDKNTRATPVPPIN